MKWRSKVIRLISLAFLSLVFVGPVGASAQEEQTVKPLVKQDIIRLMEVADQQRMLSQRMAKDYLYRGQRVAADKAKRQLRESLQAFAENQEKLKKMINDEEIRNLISFVDISLKEFQGLTRQPYNLDNAQLAMDLSESMLEGNQYIINTLTQKADLKESQVVERSGRQRMLAQRIAKYYIAFQAGIKDKNTIDQMRSAVAEFDKNHKALLHNPDNTASINQKLASVQRLWKIVYKFYLNIEKGGLPFIVFTTTDDITKKMDEVTKLYVQLYL